MQLTASAIAHHKRYNALVSTLTDEHEADQAVIHSLLETIAAYQQEGDLEMQRPVLLVQDENGIVKRVLQTEQLTRQDILDAIDAHEGFLAGWRAALIEFDNLVAANPEPTEAPAPTPEPVPEVAAPTAEAPTPENTQPAEQTAAPAELQTEVSAPVAEAEIAPEVAAATTPINLQ